MELYVLIEMGYKVEGNGFSLASKSAILDFTGVLLPVVMVEYVFALFEQ